MLSAAYLKSPLACLIDTSNDCSILIFPLKLLALPLFLIMVSGIPRHIFAQASKPQCSAPLTFFSPSAFLTPICQPPLLTVFKMHSHVLTFCAAAAQALVAALHSCLGPWQWSPQLVFPWCLSVHNGHSDLLKNKPGCTTCLNPQQLPVTVGPEYPGLVPGSSQILKSMAAQSLIQNNMVFAYKLRTSSGILYIISRLLIIPNTVYI